MRPSFYGGNVVEKSPPDDLRVSPGGVDGPDLLLGSSVQGHVVLLRVEMDFVVGNLSQPCQ